MDLSELSRAEYLKNLSPTPPLAHFVKLRFGPVPRGQAVLVRCLPIPALEGLTFVVSLRDAGCLTGPWELGSVL